MNNMLVVIARKVLGNSNFSLDSRVPFSYVLQLGLATVTSLIRGGVRWIGRHGGKRLMIGKRSHLRAAALLHLGKNVRIGNDVIIDALSANGVTIGDHVKIGDHSVASCTGSLSSVGKGMKIGHDSFFSENTFFGAAGGIEIGSDVISGQNVRFHSENHQYTDHDTLIRNQGVTHKGIKIGSNVWIGAGAVFLDGAIVPDGCVVGANAVVTKEFPENSILAGIPARRIKSR